MNEELPPGWATVALGKLGEWMGGGTPSKEVKEYWQNGTVHWVSPKDMKRPLIDSAEDQITEKAIRESSTKLVPANSVLMVTRSGILDHTFPVAVNTVPVAMNQDLKAVAVREVSPVYTSYFLQSREQDILSSCKKDGTTVASIDSDRLAAYPVAIAPVPEQQRIVSKIDELFSRIDEGERALERVRTLIERYRQSVLKAAVTGELTRDWREKNKDKLESGESLLARLLTARREAWEKAELDKMKAKGVRPANDKWKQKYKEPVGPDISSLPALPRGWTWATPVQLESSVPNALTIGPFGSNLKVSDYTTSGVPLIFVRNIRAETFADAGGHFVSAAKARELSTHTARAGDLLITKMGDPPGDACLYPFGSPDAIITADCIKWTLHPALATRSYFAAFINSALGRSQIAAITKGVAQQKVSLERFRQIAIALPGPEEQALIAERLETDGRRQSEVRKAVLLEARRSASSRQAILSAAFRGNLVAQSPLEEPAAKLLDRVAAERALAQPQLGQRRSGKSVA